MVGNRVLFVVMALVSVATIGCQRPDSLSGSVTYNGQSVDKGSIAFQPAEGTGSGFGAEIKDGQYIVEKASPGKFIASIRGVHTQLAPQSTEEAIRQYEAAKAAGKTTLDHYGQPADYIPEDAVGNGQTVEISPGSNTLDFALRGPSRSG